MTISFRDEEFEPLKPRTAVLEVKGFEEHTSKKGNLCLHFTGRVEDGGEYVHEYLPPTRESVTKVCQAAGVPVPEGNELDPNALIGRRLKVKLKVEPGNDGYPDRYRVEKWSKTPVDGGTKPVQQERVAAAISGKGQTADDFESDVDDSIPF